MSPIIHLSSKIKNDTARCLTTIHKPAFAEMLMRCRFYTANRNKMRFWLLVIVRRLNYSTNPPCVNFLSLLLYLL